jgi:hypothetical protein
MRSYRERLATRRTAAAAQPAPSASVTGRAPADDIDPTAMDWSTE